MTLLITPGMGIGPEVTARALIADPPSERVVLIGRGSAIRTAADQAGLALIEISELSQASELSQGQVCMLAVSGDDEPVEVAAIRLAAEACLSGGAEAMVTGPIHKGRLAAEGFAHKGHTELLGEICGAAPVMAFVGGTLKVALVTTHIPLCEVPAAIRADVVGHVARTAAEALRADLGITAPRVAVCGLNPHAGEGGLLGSTEQTQIAPACDVLREEGWEVWGPISAETAFMDAHAGKLDLVVAMYHDQGLVPLKLVDFGRSVNWTLGLPIIRTSVDHGTADDLCGTGQADSASMQAAIGLARRIAARRAATPCP